jgi:hypothetical protein
VTDFGKKLPWQLKRKFLIEFYTINYKTMAFKGNLRKIENFRPQAKYVMPYFFILIFPQKNQGVELSLDVTNKIKIRKI